MFKNLTRANIEQILKFIICGVLGTGIGVLLGNDHSPTIAVTAILVLYFDRGVLGHYTYACKRVIAQLIAGAIVLALMVLLKWLFPIENWIIGMIVCVLAMPIAMMLFYRFDIAPLSVSMGNAVLIIIASLVAVPPSSFFMAYVWRVVYCTMGLVLAFVVNAIVSPYRDRYQSVCSILQKDTTLLIETVEQADRNELPHVARVEKDIVAIENSIKKIDVQLAFIYSENRVKRYEKSDEEMNLIDGIYKLQKHLMELLTKNDSFKCDFDQQFLLAYYQLLEAGIKTHKQLLAALCEASAPLVEPIEVIEYNIEGNEAIIVIGKVLQYINLLNRLIQKQIEASYLHKGKMPPDKITRIQDGKRVS